MTPLISKFKFKRYQKEIVEKLLLSLRNFHLKKVLHSTENKLIDKEIKTKRNKVKTNVRSVNQEKNVGRRPRKSHQRRCALLLYASAILSFSRNRVVIHM